MGFDPDAYFGTVAEFEKKQQEQPAAFNPDAYFGTIEDFNKKQAQPAEEPPAPAPYEPPQWVEPPQQEEIKAAPTVFGEIGKGNFKSAGRLAKDAFSRLMEPTQPTSALQVHGESGRSLLGTSEQVPADPKDDGPTRFGKAAVNATNRFMAGLTTPEALPLLTLGGAPGIGRAIAGGFAGDVISQVPEIADRIKKSEDTKAWSQERWETALDTSLNAIFFKGMLTHAVRGGATAPPKRPSEPAELGKAEVGSKKEEILNENTQTTTAADEADARYRPAAEAPPEAAEPATAAGPDTSGPGLGPQPGEPGGQGTAPENRPGSADLPVGEPAAGVAPGGDNAAAVEGKAEGGSKKEETLTTEEAATKAAGEIPGLKFDGVQRWPEDTGLPDELQFSITDKGRETSTTFPVGSVTAADLAKWKTAKVAEYDAAEEVKAEVGRQKAEGSGRADVMALAAEEGKAEVGSKKEEGSTEIPESTVPDAGAPPAEQAKTPESTPIPAAMGAASVHEPLAHYEMRQFAARVQADTRLSAEAREAIGNRYYEPIPNVQTAAEAEALVAQRGPVESVKIITDETNGLEFRHRVTMGLNTMFKLNEAYDRLKPIDPAAADKILDAQSALSEFSQELGTRLGQGVQSFKMWQRMGPDGKLRMLQNQIKRVRDKFTQTHKDDVTEIVEQINEGGDVAKQKENLIEKEANRIARILSDTPAWDKLRKGKKGNEALALIRAHLKGVQPDFVKRLIAFGADPQLAIQIHRMAAVNRARIDTAAKVRGIQAREKSLDGVANRIARHLSDTPDFQSGNKGAIDPARLLIKKHLLKPQPNFIDSLVKLGATRKTAEVIDRMAMENRRRVLVVDRANRVRALEKLYGRTGNKVARAIPKPIWNKIIDLADAGLLTNDSFYDLAARRLGLPVLDQAGRRELARMAHEIQKAPEGIPKDTATLELTKFIAKNMGFAPKDLPLGIYYGNMLSGYNTHIVNSLDTLLNVTSEVSTLAAGNPQAAATIYRGMLRGLLEGRNDAMLAFTRGRMISDGKWMEAPRMMDVAEFGKKGGVPISEKTFWGRVGKTIGENKLAYPLNTWKYVGRLLAASDAIMFRGAEEARLALLADRLGREEGLTGDGLRDRINRELGLTQPQQENFEAPAAGEGFKGAEYRARVNELRHQQLRQDAREDARDFAGRATYNHAPEGMLGYFAKGFAAASEKFPLLKFFVPFTQIVANVTNRGLNYTPLGYKRALRGFSGGEPLTGDARAAMIMRANIGTAAVGTLIAMQANGVLQIHGNGPTDIERRRQLLNAGFKPYSLQIGPHFFTYTYSPVGLYLSIVGNMTDAYRYKEMSQKDAVTRGVYAVSRLGSTVFSQSFLAGLSNLFKALSGEGGDVITAMKQSLAQTAGSLTTPTIVRDLQRLWDPQRYSSDSIEGDLLRNTPFAALTNKPVLNAFGEPIRPPTNRFYSHISDDPAWQKVLQYNLRVPVPDKYTDMPDGKGGKRPMTEDEYYRYLKVSGPMIKKLVKGMQFQNVPPELGQKMLSEAAQSIRAEVLLRLRLQAKAEAAE